MLLNPDTRVFDGDGRQARQLPRHQQSEVGAVGPRLVYPDGTLQWSARRFPRLLATFDASHAATSLVRDTQRSVIT